jgi:prepilin-type N-terminal cleavage/methylation domain-containing protein
MAIFLRKQKLLARMKSHNGSLLKVYLSSVRLDRGSEGAEWRGLHSHCVLHRPERFQERATGFSLIELMIVIAIAMMLISLTTINARFLNRAVIISEINLLHAACSYLQQTAMATNQAQELIVDVAANSYSMNGQIHKLPAQIKFGIIEAKGPPSSPHTILHEPITFANNTITFSSDGIISSGTLYLTDSHVLYALSSAVGHVSFLRKYRYDGKWHLM